MILVLSRQRKKIACFINAFGHPAISQFLIVVIILLESACKSLKIAQIAQDEKKFQSLNVICVFSKASHRLSNSLR